MTAEQTDRLIDAIERLSTGTNDAPTGAEAISMALCGTGTPGHDSVASGLHDIAGAIRQLAEALESMPMIRGEQ